MSDTPRTDAETMRDECDHVDTEFGPFAPSVTVGVDFARQLERELAEVTKLRDELGDALQRFVNRLQYSSVYMNGKMTCARVNRNPIKEWDEDCIFAFEVLEKLKGGEG